MREEKITYSARKKMIIAGGGISLYLRWKNYQFFW